MVPGQRRVGTEQLNLINLSISAGLFGQGWAAARPVLQVKHYPLHRLLPPTLHIFVLTLQQLPGCYGDRWSNFSFLRAFFFSQASVPCFLFHLGFKSLHIFKIDRFLLSIFLFVLAPT